MPTKSIFSFISEYIAAIIISMNISFNNNCFRSVNLRWCLNNNRRWWNRNRSLNWCWNSYRNWYRSWCNNRLWR